MDKPVEHRASGEEISELSSSTDVTPLRYRAFISYSRHDWRLAYRLRKKLESYWIPGGLESNCTPPSTKDKDRYKLGQFFVDYDELAASADLGPALQGALDDSENLIVIASRHAALSKWVNEEVSYFKKRWNRPILALIISGAPNDPQNECFPEALRGSKSSDGVVSGKAKQPGAPDLQKEAFSRVFIRLVAGILGVHFDTLWERDRRRKRIQLFSICVFLLAFASGVLIPTLMVWDRYDRGQSVDDLIVEAQSAIAQSQYELAMQTALEGLPVAKDVPWALTWSDVRIKRLGAKLAGAAELSSLIGGAKDFGNVTSVTFSPDGRRLLTSTEGDTATVWDTKSLKPVAQCSGKKVIADSSRKLGTTPNGAFKPGLEWIRDSKFNSDGGRIISTGYFGSAWIWAVEAGECKLLTLLLGHISDVRTGAFSPDGIRAVTTSDDYTVRIWDVESGRSIGLVALPKSRKPGIYTTDAEFSPDGRNIVFATSDGLIAIADAQTFDIAFRLQESGACVWSANYSKDGRWIISSSDDGSIVIWNAKTGQKIPLQRQARSVDHATFSPDGSLVLTASSDGTARIWDATELTQKFVFRGHKRSVTSAAFAPDGRTIVTGSADGTFRIWDAVTNVIRLTVHAHNDAVLSASMSSDQADFVTGGADGSAVVWEIGPDARLRELGRVTVDIGTITGVAFGRDANRIFTASSLGEITAWDVGNRQGTAIPENQGFHTKVTPSERGTVSVAVSHNARFIAAGSDYDDKTKENNRIWEVATKINWPLQDGTRIVSLEFSANDSLVVGASESGVVLVWDRTTGSVVHTLGHNIGFLTSAHFNFDGSRVVVSSRGGIVRIFDVATERETLQLVGHEGDVNAARFSPDGELIVTASGDRSVRVWDADTGVEMLRFLTDQEPSDAHFIVDGDHLIATMDDGQIVVFAIEWTKRRNSELIKMVCSKKVGLIEQVTGTKTNWRNRITSISSSWIRQVDACKQSN